MHILCTCPSQDLYPIGRRCNSTYCVNNKYYGVYIGDNSYNATKHCALRFNPTKVSINNKDDYKTVMKYHMVLSLFPRRRIQYNETVSVFMYAIRKPATCEGVADQ